MITQKPISLKIDTQLLEDLDKEVSLGWQKRNTIINQAIGIYLKLLDGRRSIRSFGNIEDKRKALNSLLRVLVPESIGWPVPEKYILSEASEESFYDQVAIESCNTDCLQYRQGTCPYRYNAKMSCLRFKQVYNAMQHSGQEEGSDS